ncbi:hypothetical protein EON79_02305 [bacterium]|nr:MAG: hypothetical protein EON79_02305 [bacterium]
MATVVLGQTPEPSVDAVDGRYEVKGGAGVEMVGVCELTSAGVRCWNRSAVLDPSLTALLTREIGKGGGNEAMYRRGFKNRYYVFKTNGPLGIQFSSQGSGGFGGGKEERWTFARVLLDAGTESFDAFVTILNTGELPSATVPFAPEQTLDYQGFRFVVGKAVPASGSDAFFHDGMGLARVASKAWAVTWSVTSPPGKALNMKYAPLDEKGKEIEYVDEKGNPISEAVYRASLAKTENILFEQSEKGYSRAWFNGSASFGLGFGGPGRATTSVNPAAIGSIRVTAMRQVRVRFPNLPADPKPVAGGTL